MLARRMPGILAAAHDGGTHRGDEGPQCQRRGQWDARHAEAVQGAAPHRLDLRARRRREQSAAGRGVARAPRGAVPRRVARVWQDHAGGLASAPGGWPRDHLAGGGDAQLPCAGHAALFHEPVSLRARWRQEEGLPVYGGPDRTLPGAHLGAFARPHGYLRRRPASHAPGIARRAGWRKHQRSSGSGWAGRVASRPRRQGSPNSMLSGRLLRQVCALRGDAEMLFSRAVDRMGLSGRGHDRVLRVARTVADLAQQDEISAEHVAEALNYRRSHLVGR